MRKVVIGLSGGMDSATLLGLLLEQGTEIHACIFSYGSKHNPYENYAANEIIEHYRGKGFTICKYFYNLENIFYSGSSVLLKDGGDIPEGHYNDDNMKLTVVPGRNLIFASIMASLAESIEATEIALGVHSGDHHIYPDCRPAFINSLDLTIQLSSDLKVKVTTPLINENKTTILKMGIMKFKNKVPYHLTRTCYKAQELSCGKCGSCVERLEAFTNLGLTDPIKYE